MNLRELLIGKEIDPQHVLVLRHRPTEPKLNKVLPWLAAERPDVFNAYQQTQRKKVEGQLTRAKYVASFIGHEPGKALFIGLYSVAGSKPMTRKEFWRVPAYIEMKDFGMKGWVANDGTGPSILWFDLVLTEFYSDWKGKLIVRWPPPERAWNRWAHNPKNEFPVDAVLDESALDRNMPEWSAIDLTWTELSVLPKSWKAKLKEWRGIYYIFDRSDCKGYVGAAYGANNIFGRWENYKARGHGGNNLLRTRNPDDFQFTILQRVSPDMDAAEVIRLESAWKDRLHTRKPFGLNDN